MSEVPGARGSPEHVLLVAACRRAEEDHRAYEQSGRRADLERAIAGFSGVLDAAGNVDIRSAAANGLGTALWSRYEHSGRPADLDEAIRLFREALAMYPQANVAGQPTADAPTWTAWTDEYAREAIPSFYTNLAGTLRLRWRRGRSGQDLAESVDAIRAAVAATAQWHRRRSGRLSNLADALHAFHIHDNDSSALNEAIEVNRQAVDCARVGSDDFAWARANLAEALRWRFRTTSTSDRGELDEAVRLARAAVAATPSNRPLRPRFQSNLALILLSRFHALGRPSDLAEAATLAQSAVAATPAHHPNRAERQCILAEVRRLQLTHIRGWRGLDPRRLTDVPETALENRAPGRPAGGFLRLSLRRRRERRALDQLIKAAGEAVGSVPSGHILRAEALIQQGSALAVKAVVDEDRAAFGAAVACNREVALDSSAPPRARVVAARRWASCAALAGGTDWAAAMEPFQLAVGLLSETAPRRVTRADREERLSEFTRLACDAAACAIHLADPELAVQLLEQGRGVLLGQALDSRTDVTDLHEKHPAVAHRFEELRSALDLPEGAGFTTAHVESGDRPSAATLSGQDRHALADAWDQLLHSIRRLPGFERFLRPPRVSELVSTAAGHGPVVIVNVSGLRCDALILVDGQVRAVPLNRLNQAELVRRADIFRSAIAKVRHPTLPTADRESAERQVQEILEWLWTAVAEPVLAALGLTQQPTDLRKLPRLWWIPTGPLTLLPLHAAGRRDQPGACVLDRVISSYAFTLRSLIHAWQHDQPHATVPSDPPAPLIVTLATAPGFPDLPGVRDETAMLTGLLPASRLLADDQAVRQAVLEALPRHRWAHFACHAISPSDGIPASQLVLHDHRSDPLRVADIARLRLDNAELAYLSACETSVARAELGDEAIHITGAFQMAGFLHVVGTLWGVRDKIALAIADDFYATLTAAESPGTPPALALHAAVRRVRAAHPAAPVLWAPYIHVGA